MHAIDVYIFTQNSGADVQRNSREIVRRLLKEGFELVAVSGSHHKFRKNGRTVIVPHPRKDLPAGTARNIARMAGWID